MGVPLISFETNILIWLFFLSAIAFVSLVILKSKSRGRKFDFRMLALSLSSLSVISLFMLWQSGFLMPDQTSKNFASLTSEEFLCEDVPEEGSQIDGVGSGDLSPEAEASYEAWMSFIEHDLSSLNTLKQAPDLCETWTVLCQDGGRPPAYVEPSTCEMKVPTATCRQCGFATGQGYSSDQIQSCAVGMRPERLGCYAPLSVMDMCLFRHEAIHTGQDFRSMRSCEAEIPAFEDTEQCLQDWCEQCPGKCSIIGEMNISIEEMNISFMRAAIEYNRCVCKRDAIHRDAYSDDLLEIIGSTIHCSLCRAACGLSLRCAFFPGDACLSLEGYCQDMPWHLEPLIGLQNPSP